MAVPGGVLPPAMGGVGAHVVPIPHASHAASVPHAPHVVPVSRAVPATSQKQLSAWEKHKLQERNGLQQASEERVHATRAAIEAERKKQTQAAHACAEADAALQALLLEAEALSTTLAGMQNASPPSEEDIEKLIASEIQADNDKMVGQTQMLQKLKDAVEAREQEYIASADRMVHRHLNVHRPAATIRTHEARQRMPGWDIPAQLRCVHCSIEDEGAVAPCPEPTLGEVHDVRLLVDQTAGDATRLDGYVHTMKLVYLAVQDESLHLHPHDRLHLVGSRLQDTGTFTCFGGPWLHDRDGGDPTTLETMCTTLKRHLLTQTGVDIGTTPLRRLCTFRYEDEEVTYLTADPTGMKLLTLHPLAVLDSRQMVCVKPEGVADEDDEVEEVMVARVLSVPEELLLRDGVDCVEGGAYPFEVAFVCRLVDERLRRSAVQGMCSHLGLGPVSRKRKRDSEGEGLDTLPPIHEDTSAPDVPQGRCLTELKRIRVTTIGTDRAKLKRYRYFDRPAAENEDTQGCITKSTVLDALVSLRSENTLAELDGMLTTAGFPKSLGGTRTYTDLCSKVQTVTSYDASSEARPDICL